MANPFNDPAAERSNKRVLAEARRQAEDPTRAEQEAQRRARVEEAKWKPNPGHNPAPGQMVRVRFVGVGEHPQPDLSDRLGWEILGAQGDISEWMAEPVRGTSSIAVAAEAEAMRTQQPEPIGTPISELSGRPGQPGYERFRDIAASWGYD
jgi:hypothetical protein